MSVDQYHDKGYKSLLSKKRNFVKFLWHFVKHEWVKYIDEDSLQLCDKEFIDQFFKLMDSDLIYSAKIQGRDAYFFILTELQSGADNTMPYRILRYIYAILTRVFNDTPNQQREKTGFRLPVVVPILFYNGEGAWSVTRHFKDYLQDGGLFHDAGIIDFEYTLIDINLLDREYLLANHDAICAVLALDKIRGEDAKIIADTLEKIVSFRNEFAKEEYDDFLTWLKNNLRHRTRSEEEIDVIIEMVKKGDEQEMRTGIDIVFDNVEARGIAKGEARGEARGEAKGISNIIINMLRKGLDASTVSSLADIPIEQVEKIQAEAQPVS